MVEYVTLKIPKELADGIDEVLEKGVGGFKSRAELAKTAIRMILNTLEEGSANLGASFTVRHGPKNIEAELEKVNDDITSLSKELTRAWEVITELQALNRSKED